VQKLEGVKKQEGAAQNSGESEYLIFERHFEVEKQEGEEEEEKGKRDELMPEEE